MSRGWQAFSRTVAARRDHPALLMGDHKLSFGELGALAQRLAGGLVLRGVGVGDRVVLHLANGPVAAALPPALWALGAVPVLAPADLRPEALEGVAARVAARGVISDSLAACDAAPLWSPGALRDAKFKVTWLGTGPVRSSSPQVRPGGPKGWCKRRRR